MYENEGGALPKGTLNSKIATGCTQSEFAQAVDKINEISHSRSSWDPPSESKSYRETCKNTVDYRISGKHFSTVETAGYTSPKQGQEVDRKVREPPA